MSIELHVYSKHPILDRDKLAAECVWPELPADLQWQVRFLNESEELVSGGALSNGLVVGWRPGSPGESQIREVLTNRNPGHLDKLSSQNLLASVYLSVVTPAEKEDWEDIMDSAKEDVEEPRHRKYLHKVQSVYSIETAATRNDLSLEFQEQLWRMIGVLCEGLMYDPQEGEFELLED